MNEWEWQLLEDGAPLDRCLIDGLEVRIGCRVRLHPRQGGDIMDAALADKIAIIEAFEQDYDGRIQAAVVVEDDPGQELGRLRQLGHRFFFHLDELEPVLTGKGAA